MCRLEPELHFACCACLRSCDQRGWIWRSGPSPQWDEEKHVASKHLVIFIVFYKLLKEMNTIFSLLDLLNLLVFLLCRFAIQWITISATIERSAIVHGKSQTNEHILELRSAFHPSAPYWKASQTSRCGRHSVRHRGMDQALQFVWFGQAAPPLLWHSLQLWKLFISSVCCFCSHCTHGALNTTVHSAVLENRTAPRGRVRGQVKTAGAVVLRNSLAFIPGLFFILLSDPGWNPPRWPADAHYGPPPRLFVVIELWVCFFYLKKQKKQNPEHSKDATLTPSS